MGRPAIRAFVAAVTAALLAACFPVVANADPVLVFPGMEIHQGTHLCTLGYVDPGLRVAFTAGHCRGDGPVTDRDNNVIGNLATFRDNTPSGAIVELPTSRSPITSRSCWTPRRGEQHPARRTRTAIGPGPGRDARRTRLPFRRRHRRELRNRRRRSTTAGSRWGMAPSARKAIPADRCTSPAPPGPDPDRRDIQQRLGRTPAAVSWQATSQQVREDVGASGASVHVAS